MFFSLIIFSIFALRAFAQSTTTINIFLPGATPNSFAGSIVAAGNGLTTIAYECTAGSGSSCGTGKSATVIEGPSMYEFTTSTVSDGATATAIESCSLGGTTTASCTSTVSAFESGETVGTSTSFTQSGTDVHFYQIPITAGAEKLAGASETSSTKNAAPTAVGLSGMLVGGAAVVAGVLL